MLLLRSPRPVAQRALLQLRGARAVSTLPNNPHIYVHSDPVTSTHTLSLLPTSPPTPSLALGTTSSIPPTPQTFRENRAFHGILKSVLAAHAVHDPYVQGQAAAYASQAGSTLGGGGMAFPANHPSQAQRDKRRRPSTGAGSIGGGGGGGGNRESTGAGPTSAQGGAGGGARGGWVHVSDQRCPPDYGRIAWPEDMFGSVEVDARGRFVGATGNYQESGTYRMCTREGLLGLSPYLRERVVERLQELERQEKAKGN
ncbi:hypothetical protein GTA08_BOTSDO11251 [Neofusicoccum parvum]|uniref:Uncharacterized protein n=1 Tax=Neofusicoccum parvum TaxID=310453 RepID=A0ACB5S6R5_9PEZI|nr:hypothetical protein GTA08_BOTSDO11251 [Neofusicoccum parvum]